MKNVEKTILWKLKNIKSKILVFTYNELMNKKIRDIFVPLTFVKKKHPNITNRKSEIKSNELKFQLQFTIISLSFNSWRLVAWKLVCCILCCLCSSNWMSSFYWVSLILNGSGDMKSIRCHLEGSQECAGVGVDPWTSLSLNPVLRCCLLNRIHSSY